jgi:hypothetical protein
MAIGPLKKIAAKRANEICAQVELSADAQKLANDQLSPDAYLDLLIEKEQWVDAIRLLAFALPKREAVWWAAGCVRAHLPADAPPKVLEALKSAEAWVYKPTEENRWAAKEAGEKVGYDKPACWATMGAFWSGGSLVPAHLPSVTPSPAFAPGAVAGAILMVGAQDPAKVMENYKLALDDGLDIANGGTGKRRARGEGAGSGGIAAQRQS